MNVHFFLFLYSLAHRTEWLDTVIIFFADPFGNVFLGLLVGAMVLFLVNGSRDRSFTVLIALSAAGLAWLTSSWLKDVFQIGRPFLTLDTVSPLFLYGNNDSFPSGHAALFFALSIFLYTRERFLGGLSLLVAVLVSISRVAAGIHWPFDILGGAVLGCVIALAIGSLYDRIKARTRS